MNILCPGVESDPENSEIFSQILNSDSEKERGTWFLFYSFYFIGAGVNVRHIRIDMTGLNMKIEPGCIKKVPGLN